MGTEGGCCFHHMVAGQVDDKVKEDGCHYRTKQWCEVDANGVGGVGSKWGSDWTWAEDADGKTALDACCVCGGDGIKGERYTWHH